jgi:hypothetical protein
MFGRVSNFRATTVPLIHNGLADWHGACGGMVADTQRELSMKMRDFWIQQAREQRQWIADHGATLAGYMARYGDYGNGGAAIFHADMGALEAIERRITLR